MDEKRREYMRQYMAKKRLKASWDKTPEVQTKDLRTDGDLGADTELTESRSLSKAGKAAEYQTVAASTNLPVPVLAEPEKRQPEKSLSDGEARESTNVKVPGNIGPETSRGGQNTLSGGVTAGNEEAGSATPAPPAQTLSKTDQKFDEDRPNWYIFGVEVKEGKCWTCGKPFKTQLEMNRFCSPKCKNEYLATISSSKNEISV